MAVGPGEVPEDVGGEGSTREGHHLVGVHGTADIEDEIVVGTAADDEIRVLEIIELNDVESAITGDGRSGVDGGESLGCLQTGGILGNALRGVERAESEVGGHEGCWWWILQSTAVDDTRAVVIDDATIGEAAMVSAGCREGGTLTDKDGTSDRAAVDFGGASCTQANKSIVVGVAEVQTRQVLGRGREGIDEQQRKSACDLERVSVRREYSTSLAYTMRAIFHGGWGGEMLLDR